MITGVRGILETRGPNWVQVRVGGSVSLQIFTPASTVETLGDTGEEVQLHTRLYIRDDEPVLYGFTTSEALALFQKLNGVAGVGPRTSMSLLSALGPQSLLTAVVTGDADTLSKVPGVGRKSASRLILELKGKLEKELGEVPFLAGAGEDGEVVSALMALGYSANESRKAMSGMGDTNGMPVEEKIRRALQQLAG